MPEFATWRAFHDFQRSVASNARFVREPEAEAFLQIVVNGAKEREFALPEGTLLWRAQVGSTWRDDPEHPGPEAFGPERMKPRPGRAYEGRVNPKGIPVLYLATTKETAMAEVRPHKGADLSIAQFKIMRDLTLVDFSTAEHRSYLFLKEPDGPERDEAVWADIDRAFSAPTERSDDGPEYVATQVIADAIRSEGYDGIAFQSGLVEGHNVALFDLDAAEQINGAIWELREVSFRFEQAGNPFFITKHYPQLAAGEAEPASEDD